MSSQTDLGRARDQSTNADPGWPFRSDDRNRSWPFEVNQLLFDEDGFANRRRGLGEHDLGKSILGLDERNAQPSPSRLILLWSALNPCDFPLVGKQLNLQLLLIFRIDGIQKNQPFSLEHSRFQSTLHKTCVFLI